VRGKVKMKKEYKPGAEELKDWVRFLSSGCKKVVTVFF